MSSIRILDWVVDSRKISSSCVVCVEDGVLYVIRTCYAPKVVSQAIVTSI